LKKNMKKSLFTLFFILSCFISLAQLEMRINPYIKGEIVLKNDSIKKGYIKFDDSAFKVRFKKNKEQKSKEKIDHIDISKIILFSKSSSNRVFFYKKTDADKFSRFVELIYSGKYNIYLYSSNNLSLFYKDVDRSNVRDFLSFGSSFQNAPYYSVSEIKRNLEKVVNPKYLLDLKNSEKLNFIYSNRKLRKNANTYFKGCYELISKIGNKELKLDNIIEIIDFYNNCRITEIEKK